MCANLKTWIPISLALHLALMAWVSPGGGIRTAGVAPLARWNTVMVELPRPAEPAAAAEAPGKTPPAPSAEAEPGDAAPGGRDGAEGTPSPGSAESGETAPADTADVGGVAPIRIVRNEEFARMAYIAAMSAKAMSYSRSAPKGFERLVRSALPSEAFGEDGEAVVLIDLTPSGDPGDIDIRSGSPALLSALRRIRWEAAPLPARYQVPCRRLELRVSVAGERLAVAMKLLQAEPSR